MFKNLGNYFKNDPCGKNVMKICVVYYYIAIITFLGLFMLLIFAILHKWNIDKSVYRFIIYVFHSVFISYSLSVFIINSNEIQQQKYRFLGLFLFISALNPLGIISILMLMKKQKNKNDDIAIKATTKMIKPEKWFLIGAIYSSIGMMILIIPIPLSIINLINIKKSGKKVEIDMQELKKIAYFSSDIYLMIASKFAF